MVIRTEYILLYNSSEGWSPAIGGGMEKYWRKQKEEINSSSQNRNQAQ